MDNKLYKLMNWPEIEAVVYSETDNPHALLGAHMVGTSTLVQTFIPGAQEVMVKLQKGKLVYKMEMADEEGFFAALIPDDIVKQKYTYVAEYDKDHIVEYKETYNHKPVITREEAAKFNAGIHDEAYHIPGAHPMKLDGDTGVLFAVWAPNAMRVSVVGDFNGWDGRRHQMRRLWDSGIYELFIPDAKCGENYKYEVKMKGGVTVLKADPYAFGMQKRQIGRAHV